MPDGDLDQWHQHHLALLVRDPTPALCQQASQRGVVLVVWLDPARPDQQLEALAPWASVAVGILPEPPDVDPARLRQAAPNILLGQYWTEATAGQASDWADLWICDADLNGLSQAHQHPPACCVLSWRPVASPRSVAEARVACESLQRDLAPRFDLSGYLV